MFSSLELRFPETITF